MMKKHTVDMTRGNILKLIIAFAIPIMISGVLQTLYTAADMIVVGKFAGKESLAAVGSTSPAINMMLNIFIGMSSATSVIVARKFGAGDKSGVSKAVHTAITVCIAGGIFLAIAGVLLSKKILLWMSSPEDVINLSTLYMQIYFMGIPASLLYNFGSAILRAVGDSKRPTYYLMAAGIVNLLLNIVFVVVFKLDVSGVALATVISKIMSATLVLRNLVKTDDCYRLIIKKIRAYSEDLKEIIFLGIPAGMQGVVVAFSNILIQSSINSCGSDAMAGNSAASSVESIVYTAMNAFFHATLTFVGQNYGAHDFKRIRRGFGAGVLSAFTVGIVICGTVVTFSNFFVRFYTDNPYVIDIARLRLHYVCTAYFLSGIMEVGLGGLRGIGVATRAMLICVLGVCGVRIITTILASPYETVLDLIPLYISYPVSWAITAAMLTGTFFLILRNKEREWKLIKEELI